MSFLPYVQHYWQQHGIVGVLAAWVVISGCLNMIFRLKSPEGWVVWADANPKTKIIVDAIRGWGTDPVALLEAMQTYSQKKAERLASQDKNKESGNE